MSNTVVLKNAELFWAKLDPNKPVSPFGAPLWEMQVRTRDKAQGAEWKKAGLNVKPNDDDEGIYYSANVKRKAIFEKTGEKMSPVVVVDGKLMPIETTSIGNGSIGNVQLRAKPYDVAGRQGISIELKAIQVTKLVEYAGSGGNGLAFDELGDTEIVQAAASAPAASSDDLWD